jgi:hypothetical protein
VKKVSKKYLNGAAAGFIEEKLAGGFVSFPLDDLVAQTGLSIVAARNQLLRLGNGVVRVSPRQQYFLIVTPEHRSFGTPPVEWWMGDYMQWLGCPYYLALQSAAAVHGSSQQAIMETQVITDLPRRMIEVGRIRIRFFMKAGVIASITQQMSGGYAPLNVSTPETTAFDLIRYAHNLGGVERMAETVTPMLPSIKAKALHRMLVAENEIATSQRLGFVLDTLGAASLANVVRDWLPLKLQRVLLALHMDDDKSVSADSKWGVVNNARCFL